MQRALVVGLGSMGKRRIRCLQSLGVAEIVGYDPREDRRTEAADRYKIDIISNVDAINFNDISVVVISTPPDFHTPYMEMAIRARKPFFIEASVLSKGLQQINVAAQEAGVVAAPSATLLFHPAVRRIIEAATSGSLGKLNLVTYHSGQYLPDWHSYEGVEEYYVSRKQTGGAREIVPFELSWLTRLTGYPQSVHAQVTNNRVIPGAPEIDDTYLLSFSAPNCAAVSLAVDVVARAAQRRLMISGSKGLLTWDWNEGLVRIYHSETKQTEEWRYQTGQAATGYNANIGEQMYIDEVKAFLDAAAGKGKFPNDLAEDIRILAIMEAAEASSASKKD